MVAAQKLTLVSVEDYLAAELKSPRKHEYLGGFVHAMAGASNNHNVISGNVFASLHSRLRGRQCRPYNSDTKIRVILPWQVRFYYPDVSVICESNSPHDSFQDAPILLVEVISKATRRTDTGEKLDAYQSISTLSVYLLVEQDIATVTAFRRIEGNFKCEVFTAALSDIFLAADWKKRAVRNASKQPRGF